MEIEIIGGDVDPELLRQAEEDFRLEREQWDVDRRRAFETAYENASSPLNLSARDWQVVHHPTKSRLKITVEWV